MIDPASPPFWYLLFSDRGESSRSALIYKSCTLQVKFIRLMHEEGAIPEENRVRLSEEAIRESMAIIRSLNASLLKESDNAGPSSGTSVTIAIASGGGEAMSGSNRSVTARDITGSSVVTGDRNTVTTTMKRAPSPQADPGRCQGGADGIAPSARRTEERTRSGQARPCVRGCRRRSRQTQTRQRGNRRCPRKVFKYMKAAGDFTENAGKLLPPLTALAAWLGPLGHQLLSVLPPMP